MRAKITGTGMYAPPRVETAADLAERLGVDEEWVEELTGVHRRHVAEETVDSMAAKASRLAIGDRGPPDLVLYASATARQAIPDTSVYLLKQLGLVHTPGWSVHATCLSFLVGLYNAFAFVHG